MIYFKIMSSDGVRKNNGFCKMSDPNIINKDILSIINNLYNTDYKVLDFNDPFIQSIKVEYISCDNPYGWGLYPLYWAYTDMMNFIGYKYSQGLITNNFLTKVEEVYIAPESRHRVYCLDDNTCPCNIVKDNTDMGYDILTDYLASKYGLGCYQLMYDFNPRIMVFQKDENESLDNYILSTGFDPYKCISYFCPNEMFEIKDLNLPYTRCYAMNSILKYKLGKHTPILHGGAETTVDVERGMNYNLSTIKKCLEYLHRYDFCNLKKTIEYDMQQDQEIVNRMANMKPGVYQVFIDKDGYKHNFSSLTHTPNVRMDYKFYRCQNAMIKEAEEKYRREHPELFKEDPNVKHMTGEELLALAEQQKKEREELARKIEQEKIAKARYNFLHGKKYGAFNNHE